MATLTQKPTSRPAPSRYSARNAGIKGNRSAARVAMSDIVKPDTNTANSNKPSETPGSCA